MTLFRPLRFHEVQMMEADWNLRMGFSWQWNCVMGQLPALADKLCIGMEK